ncbi:MAG: hypothetical protein KF852_07120 [Saprospiraceae bacterium]|nr:hypothetical protein [Saprospiraceae bacterium]
MQHALLPELIRTFSPSEQEEARRWLRSPAHNLREDLPRLFEALLPTADQDPAEPDREQVWGAVFPTQAFDDQEYRLRCSYLLSVLEDWLVWRRRRDFHLDAGAVLLAAYRERGLDRHFRRRLPRSREVLEHSPLRSPEYYLAQFQLEREAYLQDSRGDRLSPKNLQEQDDALSCALIGMKLRQACLALAHEQVVETGYRLAFVEEAMRWAQQPPYAGVPAVAVYRDTYSSLIKPDDDAAFRQCRESIFRHYHCFTPEDLRDLLLLALNTCIRNINRGRRLYLKEALELYRLGLESSLLTEHGYLTPYTYNNITGIALRLAEYDWAEAFVNDYKTQLAPEHQNTLYALNAARLAYSRKQYTAALRHLQSADYRDFFHQMTARIMQLKIYYETGENDLLSAHLKNTRALLRRRRTSYHEQNYLHIIRFTEQLLRLRPYAPSAREKLRQKIETTEPLTERDWLLGQM